MRVIIICPDHNEWASRIHKIFFNGNNPGYVIYPWVPSNETLINQITIIEFE